MTPAGDISYSQKKRAMLPGFYSFRALGIPMIEDYSCCHLQEISGNNVVILFQQNVQYCYPRNWLNNARTLLNIQQLTLLGSNKTSFFTKYFWYLLLTNYNNYYPKLLEWVFFWACICIYISTSVDNFKYSVNNGNTVNVTFQTFILITIFILSNHKKKSNF